MTGVNLHPKSAKCEPAALASAVQNFSMYWAMPLSEFGTPDFTPIIQEVIQALLSTLGAAVEAELATQPTRAAIEGIYLLNALATLSEDCVRAAK